MDAVQRVGVLVPELAGDDRADVASPGGVLRVAQGLGHQGRPPQGTAAAFRLFAAELVGFDTTAQQARVAAGEMPPNAEFFLAREYVPISRYNPDLDTRRRHRVPVVTAAGRDSADAYYARTAGIQAERLGCPCVEFPGNHLGFMFQAGAFAAALRSTLAGFAPEDRPRPQAGPADLTR
ncbi:hypothetical protein [Amycolatopsis granulosa]|uniref:hypothetical protein n=1 Tax=Amycolatopsis granulosa TaxID=185684 RepID=UPI001420D853|nr:hypothetical protein [Amycolatopsis granulosa]NIH83532.1 hypothetical protein [Amycolatopsis granulosa]